MAYMINGQPANISEEPFEQDGKNYVPLDEVVRALGGNVNWDNDSKTAHATIGQWTANVQMADTNVDVNGTPVSLSAPPLVENDKMYVPWDFFKSAYGYKADMQNGNLDIHL